MPDYLSAVYPNRTTVKIGVLFELVEVALVMGLAFILFPLLKKKSETLAMSYVGFRVFESMMLIVAIVAALMLVTLSNAYILSGSNDAAHFETIGALLKELRADWSLYVLALFHPLAAIPMYWFFMKTKLVPRFISVWGLIAGVGLILDEVILGSFGMGLFRIAGTPIFGIAMGANEIVMGIWLMIKGFNDDHISASQSDQ